MGRSAIGCAVLAVFALAAPVPPAQADEPPPLTPLELRAALAAHPEGAAAEALAGKLRAWFGAEEIKRGETVKSVETDVAVALEAAGTKDVRLISADRRWSRQLAAVGATGLWALSFPLADGTAMHWAFEVDRHRVGGGEIEVYSTHPDERVRPGVPKGTVHSFPKWHGSKIFAGTERDLSIYVPAQVTPEHPAAVMVFNDGESYVKYVPTVLDNLIAAGDMPVTVGIFVSPGSFKDGRPNKSNRAFEYDTLSDAYVRFLLDEVFPEAEKLARLSKVPEMRAIAGASSGGICAFTAAWRRPDAFRKVVSWVGSFVDIAAGKTLIEGGHNYPALVRKTPPKPIRVFMQDGDQDLNNEHGNWVLANLEMESALRFAGYDLRAVFGHGFHGHRHGRAILPDTLRWLWRDHAATAR